MQNNYWVIETWEGEQIKVKPASETIAYIQKMIAKGEGAITTPSRTIVVKSIKDFHVSEERYTEQKLLPGIEASSAPIETDFGIKSRWVKKSVPKRRYNSFYSSIPGYKLLEDSDNFVAIAFKLPINQIDPLKVEELSPDDQFRMAKIEY